MNLKTLAEPQILLDAAFARGRKAASQYPKQKTKFYTLKGKQIAMVDASANYLEEFLMRPVHGFPDIGKLEPFYLDLFTCIVDVDEARKNLSSISSVAKIIVKLRRETIVRLKELRFGNAKRDKEVRQREINTQTGAEDKSKRILNAYIGRVASLINGLKKQIAYYNEVATKLRELPSIKTYEECFFLAGFPNVGKSTLMGKITTSKPEVAAYPFTTKGLNVGHFIKKHIPIQVIDTPGLLDRPLYERNNIELKAITALQHLKGTILFVVDPTDDLTMQRKLLDEMKTLFTTQGFMVVINKTDIAPASETEKAKEMFKDLAIIIEGKGLNNLREELLK